MENCTTNVALLNTSVLFQPVCIQVCHKRALCTCGPLFKIPVERQTSVYEGSVPEYNVFSRCHFHVNVC